MDPQRWRQVEQIYHSAKERDPDQQPAFLADVCRGDEDLRREVESLLSQDTSHEWILDRPAVDLTGPAGTFVAGALLAGRFQIERTAGSGGMGFVYQAYDRKLNQRVALKCAKPGYGGRLPPEVRAAREVSHFNVCKVHDLHMAPTPQGELEFLSMEFIDGHTLWEQIERDGALPPREAREVTRQICAGLAQAHRQGVIHGDLKPGNVIIARAAGGMRVVITDFGMASMQPGAGSAMTAVRGGTPDFMAPELFLGQPSTVASDIYALGILCHVMLTGHPPRRVGTPPALPAAGPVGSRDDTITAATIIPAEWLLGTEDLPAPWNKLVGRCTAPRPEDRYGSVEEVARALEPRRIFLKGSAAAAALAAGALGYWQWSAEPAAPAVRLAVLPFSVQGDAVPAAGGIGLDVANRLSGARRNFTVITPGEAQKYGVDTPLNAKSMLGATHALETRLRHSGATITAAATLTDLATGSTLGQPLHGTYASGDSAALAKAILATVTGAFQLRARVPAESVSGAAYPLYVQGVELLQQDDYNADEAIPLFERSIQLDPRSALPYAGLADAQIRKFDKLEGAQWLDKAEANVARAGAINPDSLPVLLVSGAFQERHGFYEQALRSFTRATELDPNNPEAWRRLAGAYDRAHRADEAIATYRRAMNAQPNYYGNYLSLGNLYWDRNEFRAAEDLYRRVTAIAPGMATGYMNLGLALMQQGRFQEAEASLLHALRLRRSSMLLMNIGGLYYVEERYPEAARFFEQSVASGAASALQYHDLADAYRHLGKTREAARSYRLAKDGWQTAVTLDPRDAYSRMMLALASALLGDSDSARFEAMQALSMEPENAQVMRDAVLMYEVLGQREDTLRVLQHAPRWLLDELSRQPDARSLQQDARFKELIEAQSSR